MVANPACGSAKRGKMCFPVTFPRQPAHSRLNIVLTHGIPPAFSDGVHISKGNWTIQSILRQKIHVREGLSSNLHEVGSLPPSTLYISVMFTKT